MPNSVAFVEAGGYVDESLWDEEGRGWSGYARAEHPTFWVPAGSGWNLRLMAEEVPMPWDWPVETNCLEARAFCRWKSRATGLPVRLPTEDEWNRLYDGAGLRDVPLDALAAANLHLDHWASSCPVNAFATANCTMWSATSGNGARPPPILSTASPCIPIYDDFTTPTFDERHNIIKGGSWISTGNESRHASRYAFRRHFFQHAGFRYVVTETPATNPASAYETDALLSQYAEFHYGDEVFGVPNFRKALADIAIDAQRRLGNGRFERALDIGCATGRASFELARAFTRVVGIDFSARFIQAGSRLAHTGTCATRCKTKASWSATTSAGSIPSGLSATADRVEFWQGDACNLKEVFTALTLSLPPISLIACTARAAFSKALRGDSILAACWCCARPTPGRKSTPSARNGSAGSRGTASPTPRSTA